MTALGNLEQKQLLASPSKQNSSMALRMDNYPVADKGDEQPRQSASKPPSKDGREDGGLLVLQHQQQYPLNSQSRIGTHSHNTTSQGAHDRLEHKLDSYTAPINLNTGGGMLIDQTHLVEPYQPGLNLSHPPSHQHTATNKSPSIAAAP